MNDTIPDTDTAPAPTVLSSLGTFRIWMQLIVGPIVIVICIVLAIFVWQLQRNWKTAAAYVTNTPDCSPCAQNQCSGDDSFQCVNVQTTYTDSDSERINWTTTQESTQRLHKGDQVRVCYDPKHTNSYAGGACISSGTRNAIVGGLLLVAFLCAAYWLLNLFLRNNRNWQNVAGVLEGASLVGNALGRS